MRLLITGTAGFIGFHLARRLAEGYEAVVGLDNINDYYDVNLKYGRLETAGIARPAVRYNTEVRSVVQDNYRFIELNLEDRDALDALFERERFDVVCHLAAQAGVRYSLENPHSYVDANITGFLNVLEACRRHPVHHLVYASSSSVYGLNTGMPFRTTDGVDHPMSLYAATKKGCELMAHTYSHLFAVPTTGLRFFTVYGPWGRPDMAAFRFVRKILAGEPIDVYNRGDLKRDFTYVDDIVEGVARVLEKPPAPWPEWDPESADPGRSTAPYRLYNIGNGEPVNLMDFIAAVEQALGVTAEKNLLPAQPGDVAATWADTADLERDFGYKPYTPVTEGIRRFVKWYKYFYNTIK